MRLSIIAVLIACAAALTGIASVSSAATARPLDLPAADVLFSLQSQSGSFSKVKGTKDRFVLTLRGLPRQGIWFTDRPARDSGGLPLDGFFAGWRALGFRKDPPNAVLAVTDARDREDTVAVELGSPRYDARKGTVRFRVRTIGGASTGLAHHGPDLDKRVPARFRDAALFIDDVRTEGCDLMGEVDLYPSGVVPRSYVAAGSTLPFDDWAALGVLTTSTVASGRTFTLPNPVAPAGLGYAVCAYGPWPALGTRPADDTCVIGEVGLLAMEGTPEGWWLADGATLQTPVHQLLFTRVGTKFGGDPRGFSFKLPKIDPPAAGLRYAVCEDGLFQEPGCRLTGLKLFTHSVADLPSGRIPADGRELPIDRYPDLYQHLKGKVPSDADSFQVPNVPGPVPGTTYAICAAGHWQSPA